MGHWQLPESELHVLGDVDGLDVLEYGCGAAQWAIKLAHVGARVTGLDQSRGQLRHAAARVRTADVNVGLCCASATSVPFRDASFDLVFCDHGAMSFCDPYRTVPEVARLLRPGGRFAFNISTLLRNLCFPPGDPDALDHPQAPRQVVRRPAPSTGATAPSTSRSRHGEWIALFRANGLVVEDLLDLRPAKHATTTYGDYVDQKWARRWPAEEIWRVRKP